MDETSTVRKRDGFDWRRALGRGIQIGAIVGAVNLARDTDWPTVLIIMVMAGFVGLGEGIRES